MISRERFKEHMNRLYDLNEKHKEAANVINYLADGQNTFPYNMLDFSFQVELIVDLVEGEDIDPDESWIEYYIYILDWGKDEMAKEAITHKDGSVYSLTNLDELYDYLNL